MNIILLVEDKPEERQIAKEVIFAHGFRAAVTGTLEDALRLLDSMGDKISGVLTDMHFPENDRVKETSPCGFAVVTQAIRKKIPVSICTDINHHFCDYLKFVLADLEAITGRNVPFTMDSKNWQKALENLIKEMEEKK